MKGRNDEPMRCERARDLVALVPGSDLPPELDEPVRAHLRGCASCRQELGHYLAARRALRTLTPVEADCDPAFFADLKADTLAAVGVSQRRPPLLPRILTAAALFLVGVYFVSEFLPQPWHTLPAIEHPGARGPAVHSRMQDVGWDGRMGGYGLLGRARLHDGLAIQVSNGAGVPEVGADGEELVDPAEHRRDR